MYCVFVPYNNVPYNVNKTSVNTTAYTHCVFVIQLPRHELTCVICLRGQTGTDSLFCRMLIKNISDYVQVHKKISDL